MRMGNRERSRRREGRREGMKERERGGTGKKRGETDSEKMGFYETSASGIKGADEGPGKIEFFLICTQTSLICP